MILEDKQLGSYIRVLPLERPACKAIPKYPNIDDQHAF